MGKVIKISSERGREGKLKEILDNLEALKDSLAELLEEYESCLLYTSRCV